MANEFIEVELIYLSVHTQHIIPLKVIQGSTVKAVIERSGILELCPEIDMTKLDVGIYAKQVSLETIVKAKDRVEIYRTLLRDPKYARRMRAAREKNSQLS